MPHHALPCRKEFLLHQGPVLLHLLLVGSHLFCSRLCCYGLPLGQQILGGAHGCILAEAVLLIRRQIYNGTGGESLTKDVWGRCAPFLQQANDDLTAIRRAHGLVQVGQTAEAALAVVVSLCRTALSIATKTAALPSAPAAAFSGMAFPGSCTRLARRPSDVALWAGLVRIGRLGGRAVQVIFGRLLPAQALPHWQSLGFRRRCCGSGCGRALRHGDRDRGYQRALLQVVSNFWCLTVFFLLPDIKLSLRFDPGCRVYIQMLRAKQHIVTIHNAHFPKCMHPASPQFHAVLLRFFSDKSCHSTLTRKDG